MFERPFPSERVGIQFSGVHFQFNIVSALNRVSKPVLEPVRLYKTRLPPQIESPKKFTVLLLKAELLVKPSVNLVLANISFHIIVSMLI